jgi:hypothetical protein
MDSLTYSHPPFAARVAEVVLVEGQRGSGDTLRSVLQVWSKAGDLLAEHDRIHEDPVYAACYLRETLRASGGDIARPGIEAAQGARTVATGCTHCERRAAGPVAEVANV